MQTLPGGLALYDLTRQRLRQALAGQLTSDVDLEGILTSYAYWVCTTFNKRGAAWEATLCNYADVALRRAADDGGVVLRGDDLVSPAQVINGDAIQLAALLLGDGVAAGEDGDIPPSPCGGHRSQGPSRPGN